jgi:hypothetical protein
MEQLLKAVFCAVRAEDNYRGVAAFTSSNSCSEWGQCGQSEVAIRGPGGRGTSAVGNRY